MTVFDVDVQLIKLCDGHKIASILYEDALEKGERLKAIKLHSLVMECESIMKRLDALRTLIQNSVDTTEIINDNKLSSLLADFRE